MDLYHQILLKLDEAAGANPQKVVDLTAIIKREGFGGALDDIFDFFSREGWMVEAGVKGSARITQWGIDEARRTRDVSGGGTAEGDATGQTARAARQAAETARELSGLLEQYADALAQSTPNARKARRAVLSKLKELNEAIEADN